MSAGEISCETERNTYTQRLQYINIAVAISIWVIFSFFQRRVSFYKRFCKGIPGIVYPLDPVHTSCYRIVYLICYGAVAGEVINLVLNVGSTSADPSLRSIWAASLISILRFVEASVVYFPLFACVDAPVPVVGYITGLLFVPLLLGRQVISLEVLCMDLESKNDSDYGEYQLADDLSFTLPILIFLFLMFMWYLLSAVKEVHRLVVTPLPFMKALFEHKTTSYHVKRVRSLLKRPTSITHHKLAHRLLSALYPYDSNVQLPLRFLAAVVIMTYAVYLLTVQLSFSTVKLSIHLDQLLDSTKTLGNIESTFISKIIDYGHVALYTFRVVFPAGPILAFVWNLVIMLFMIRAVHIHFQKIARGELSFLTSKIPSPTYRLFNSMKYTSFQISFFIWSWILACGLVWLGGVVGLVLYYLLQFWRDKILLSIATIMIPVMYSLILNFVELLLVKVLFVGDTGNRHTVLRNRRLFYVFSYFLFFQNVVIGLMSSFLRIIFSVVLGLVLFFRLDRVVLMKGFEVMDQGHSTYVSFLYLEHTQNNSVLQVFKDIFVELTGGSSSTEMKQFDNGPIKNFYQSFGGSHAPMALLSRRARNRWLLAYTLLKNPMLQSLRKISNSCVDKQ